LVVLFVSALGKLEGVLDHVIVAIPDETDIGAPSLPIVNSVKLASQVEPLRDLRKDLTRDHPIWRLRD
jgi:hypothetical protein